MNRVFIGLLLFAGLVQVESTAQQTSQIGFFDMVPQAVYANPALRPKGKINVGFPGLSRIYLEHGNNWFQPDEYLNSDASGNATLNASGVLNAIDEFAITRQNVDVEIFHVGFQVDKHYFHARAAERVRFALEIPEDIFNLAVYGNAGSYQFENNTANLSGLSLNAMHYREYAVGYNYAYNDKWTFGITAKYLYGMESVETAESSLEMRTDPLTYEMTTSGGYRLNTSGVYGAFTDGEEAVQEDFGNYFFGLKNSGFGFDIGAVYKPLEKLQVEFSANDIGFIRWKTDVANYGTSNADFAYNGIDLTDFIFVTGADFNDELDNELDSLVNDLEDTYGFERSENSYTTGINGFLRYAASYELYKTKKTSGKAWLQAMHGLGNSTVPFSVSLGYHQKVWNDIQASAQYTLRNNAGGSLGAGVSLNAGFFQFYCLVENIGVGSYTKITLVDQDNPNDESSFVYFNNPNDIRVALGMNFVFGRKVEDASAQPMMR